MPENNRVIYISRTTNIGEKHKLVRVMARLNRAVWKNVREAEAMYALQLFLIAREMGELEIAEESRQILHDLLSRIRHSLERTTLKGIYSHDNFMDVIGGMDFFELFRFEKEHFMVLLDVLPVTRSSSLPSLLDGTTFSTTAQSSAPESPLPLMSLRRLFSSI